MYDGVPYVFLASSSLSLSELQFDILAFSLPSIVVTISSDSKEWHQISHLSPMVRQMLLVPATIKPMGPATGMPVLEMEHHTHIPMGPIQFLI